MEQNNSENYIDWEQSRKVKAHASCRFYRLYQFISMLETIRDHDLVTYLGRKKAFNDLQDIAFRLQNIPVTKSVRFPRNEEYVCDAIGIWQALLLDLRISLTTDISNNQTYNELQRLLNHMLIKARDHQGLIDRETFEIEMCLDWAWHVHNNSS